jgi:hypothetical protein
VFIHVIIFFPVDIQLHVYYIIYQPCEKCNNNNIFKRDLFLHQFYKGPVTLAPTTIKDHRETENPRLPETSSDKFLTGGST